MQEQELFVRVTWYQQQPFENWHYTATWEDEEGSTTNLRLAQATQKNSDSKHNKAQIKQTQRGDGTFSKMQT